MLTATPRLRMSSTIIQFTMPTICIFIIIYCNHYHFSISLLPHEGSFIFIQKNCWIFMSEVCMHSYKNVYDMNFQNSVLYNSRRISVIELTFFKKFRECRYLSYDAFITFLLNQFLKNVFHKLSDIDYYLKKIFYPIHIVITYCIKYTKMNLKNARKLKAYAREDYRNFSYTWCVA